MIIVSQDKEEIVNFSNIESIWVNVDGEERFTIEATGDTNSTLGCYKTEERAKEVLKEIIILYSWFETIKITPDSNKIAMVEQLQKNGYEKMSIYEMPED